MKYLNNLILLISNGGVMLCCVIPALLVSLGLGSTLATFLSDYPIFVKVTKYKDFLFLFAFVTLIINAIIIKKNKNKMCDINNLEKECSEVKTVSEKLYYFSLFIFIISLYLSYFY